jgi:hypothetical protein
MSKPKYSTQKMLRKKKIRRYWRIALTLSFLVVIFYGASFWSDHESIEITDVQVTGNKYVSTEKVTQIFEEAISRDILWFISKKNFIFLPRSVISAKIEQELSVESAFVRIGDDITTAEIEIIEYKPHALWCSDFSEYGGRTDCYFVNESGLAFNMAPEFVAEDLIYLGRPLSEQETSEGILGLQYVDPKLFDNFMTTIDLIKKVNILVKSISTEDMETFVLQTKAGPELYIDHHDAPLDVVNNLKTTLEQESIHENQFKNLQYIDLRFEGKVYYKVR